MQIFLSQLNGRNGARANETCSEILCRYNNHRHLETESAGWGIFDIPVLVQVTKALQPVGIQNVAGLYHAHGRIHGEETFVSVLRARGNGLCFCMEGCGHVVLLVVQKIPGAR